MRALTRPLTRRYAPTPGEVKNAWSKAAFDNYVTGIVGEGDRVRSSQAMWAAAHAGFHQILDEIGPQTVVVVGLQGWATMPDADVWLTKDVQGYCLSNCSIAMC
jgi:hypothetical protein